MYPGGTKAVSGPTVIDRTFPVAFESPQQVKHLSNGMRWALHHLAFAGIAELAGHEPNRHDPLEGVVLEHFQKRL